MRLLHALRHALALAGSMTWEVLWATPAKIIPPHMTAIIRTMRTMRTTDASMLERLVPGAGNEEARRVGGPAATLVIAAMQARRGGLHAVPTGTFTNTDDLP